MNAMLFNSAYLPPVEVAESDDRYRISIEIPGSDKSDIKIWHEQGKLLITGEKKVPTEGRIWAERVAGKFCHMFQLPEGTDIAGINASLNDGVLTVEIPKAKKSKPVDIKIQ